MPKIFRSMLAENGKPKVGSASKMLGVRVPPNPEPDLPVDGNGDVHPKSGGMSVVPDWRSLPDFLIPKRLRALRPDASGSNNLVCWSLGDGAFDEVDLTEKLRLRPDPDDPAGHGFVEPNHTMTVQRFQESLAETRDQWIKDET